MGLKQILRAIALGCLAAGAAFLVNRLVLDAFDPLASVYPKIGAPVVEELLKASYIVWLIRRNRLGFMVDAAIFGFAVGAGFSAVENIYYLHSLSIENLFLWTVRGFGTAVMHGTSTAIVGILSRNCAERRSSRGARVFLPGLGVALAIHMFYNLSLLPPVILTGLLIIGLPVTMAAIFLRSERSLHQWLGVGFDEDVDMLRTVVSGHLLETNVGTYLKSLRRSFDAEVVADMLCYLRIQLELAVRAKADLLKREAGFEVVPDPEVNARLAELRYLERSIGRTGRLALAPLLPRGGRDLWQLRLLGYE